MYRKDAGERAATGDSLRARFAAFIASSFGRNLGSMGLAQVAVRVSRLVATVILARKLGPVEFGLAAIVLTTYEIVALFTRNGITAKVVQASDADVEAVAQTAYWLTWIVCGALLVIQLIIAEPLAIMYREPQLALPIALMGLVYLVTPPCAIQCAMMQREGRMGRIALASGTQVTVDNILTAILALSGLGMWAIVLPKLIVAPIWPLVTRWGHSWRPAKGWPDAKMMAGWRDIARFSRHVVGVELMTTVQANVDNLMVGYFLGAAALGTYFFAFNAGLGISLGLISAMGGAVFAHLCAVRTDRALLSARFSQTRRTLALFFVPVILAQVALAPFYVPLVFGAKWTHAVPVLMIICLSALVRPFASTTSQLLKAVGRPDIELRWQAALTVVLIVALLIGMQFGIMGIAVAVLVVQTVMLSAFALIAPRGFVGADAAAPDNGARATEARATLDKFAQQA